MPLTIRYTDTQHQHEVQCDEIQEEKILEFVKAGMMVPQDFNLLLIDFSDEYCERVICYHVGSLGERTRRCEFGGASAWGIYRAIATIWPDINYHTIGRPPLIL